MSRNKRDRSSLKSEAGITRRDFVARSAALSLGMLPVVSGLMSRSANAASTTFDYYISPTGSDSNPGTISQPWAITAINTKRSTYAGKTVGLLDGTYYVAALAKSINDPDRIVLDVASGTAGKPTVIQSVNPRGAIIDGTDGNGKRVNAYFTGNGCGLIGQSYTQSGDVGYVTLRDLVIRKGYRYLVHFRYNAGIADGPRYSGVVIENCEIYDINLDGRGTGDNIALIMAYTTDGLVVRNCKIYNARGDRTVSDANGYGIQTWSSNNSVFEFNSISDCKDGIYVKNAYQTGCTIRNNYINLSDYTGPGTTNAILGLGFSKPGVQHVKAYNNVLIAQNGWRVVGDLGTCLQGPCQFYNNTVIASAADFASAGVEMLGNGYAQSFYNNIVYHTAASASECGDVTFTAINPGVVNYNSYPKNPKFCTAPNGALFPTLSYSTLTAMLSALSKDSQSLAGDPLFTKTGTDAAAYKLQSGSSCKNAGRTGGVSSGSVVDMGAWGGGVSQVGCDFSKASVAPEAPELSVS